MDDRELVISTLRSRLIEEIKYRRGVEKLIRFTCENMVSTDLSVDKVLESYANGVYGLTDREIEDIKKEVESIG